MKFFVTVEMPFLQKKSKNVEEDIHMAAAVIGRTLNENKMEFVDIDIAKIPCEKCENEMEASLKVGKWNFLVFELSFKVFGVKNQEHAESFAIKRIGELFPGVPLEIKQVEKTGSD